MNTDRPVVLIHSGDAERDRLLRDGLLDSFPNLGLRTACGQEEIDSQLPDAEVLIAWNFPPAALSAARNLRWFQVLGAGIDSLRGVDLPAGIFVTNIRGAFGVRMAEHTLTYMLAHAKEIRSFERKQAEHRWVEREQGMLLGKTVGILGLGSIGQVVARYCRAFGMEVFGMRRSGEAVAGVNQVFRPEQIEELLPLCDFLVLVLPSTDETKGLVTRERLHLVKPGCFIVNVGRGNVLDHEGLIEELRGGRIGGAALDVFAEEPLPESSPLWEMENVYVTPHISGINRPSDLLPALKENLRHYLRGEPLINRVDLERGY